MSTDGVIGPFLRVLRDFWAVARSARFRGALALSLALHLGLLVFLVLGGVGPGRPAERRSTQIRVRLVREEAPSLPPPAPPAAPIARRER